MAKTYNRLELDVNKKPNSIGIRPVQGDTKSRYLDVCLYENGVPINLAGEQVRITFRKADGSTFFNQGEVTDATAGRCQFALTNEILSEAKAVEAQISVWNAGGQILSTQVFEIYVSAAIPWTDAVESENEYGVLVVLFQEIQDALDTMHKIATTFGEPGDKAAEYGVDTFWGILETLAQRGDVESALQNKIKAYLNSTVGTSAFQPLDKIIKAASGVKIFDSPGTFTFDVPDGVDVLQIIACGGGGSGANGSVASTYEYIQGNAGNATVIGDLITLPGGLGGKSSGAVSECVGGNSGGDGGGSGGHCREIGEEDNEKNTGGNGLKDAGGLAGSNKGSSGNSALGGGGGGGSLGAGGKGGNGKNNTSDTEGSEGSDGKKGSGGGGGGALVSKNHGYNYGGGGGGGGGAAIDALFTIESGVNRTIQITVGVGGAIGSAAGNHGGKGGDGYVEIRWGGAIA